MSLAGITNFDPRRLNERPRLACARCGFPAERLSNYCGPCWNVTTGVIHTSGTITHYRRRAWLPDSFAGWCAAPWWALTWLLTFGRFGRLPWEWEDTPFRGEPAFTLIQRDGVGWQPVVSTLDPNDPPRGGSGVPPFPPNLHNVR